MVDSRPVFDQINLVVRDMRAMVEFYERLAVLGTAGSGASRSCTSASRQRAKTDGAPQSWGPVASLVSRCPRRRRGVCRGGGHRPSRGG